MSADRARHAAKCIPVSSAGGQASVEKQLDEAERLQRQHFGTQNGVASRSAGYLGPIKGASSAQR
jgi:hypothetical protein